MSGGSSGADDNVRNTAERRLLAGTIHSKGNKALIGHPRNIIKRCIALLQSTGSLYIEVRRLGDFRSVHHLAIPCCTIQQTR
jgi:hypothetical protein